VPLFGTIHLTLIAIITVTCIAMSLICRRKLFDGNIVRLSVGWGLVINELIWWTYRYSHEGVHLQNLPLQLCDFSLWMSALACITLWPPIVEFAYFGGIAGAGMAILTPDSCFRGPAIRRSTSLSRTAGSCWR
jgi:uncharacterized membrane protein YwaF